MDQELITEKIYHAYEMLLSRDIYLFEVDANERSITHKLAEYLQTGFSEWNVDCEYNRNGMEAKKLENFRRDIASDDTNAVTVFPDIIIHHRGTHDNLVVVEAKKSNFRGNDYDDEKLSAYKNDLGYRYAFKVTFPIGRKLKGISDISTFIEKK